MKTARKIWRAVAFAVGCSLLALQVRPGFGILTLPGRDYHVMEYNLFHQDIADNAADRIARFRAPSGPIR